MLSPIRAADPSDGTGVFGRKHHRHVHPCTGDLPQPTPQSVGAEIWVVLRRAAAVRLALLITVICRRRYR